jgi:hypothetical protein
MWKCVAVTATVAAWVAVCSSPGWSRPIEHWPYDRLFSASDLVVLAAAVKTEATDDRPPPHPWPVEFVPQNTTLRVLHALKGKADGPTVRVLHFKLGDPRKGVDPDDPLPLLILDGPLLVAFQTDPVRTTRAVYFPPDYMLFLKRLPDGRYEPVSGRIDPALSVKEVIRTTGDIPRNK